MGEGEAEGAPPSSGMLRDLGEADLPRVLELEAELFAPDDWSAGMYREELAQASRRYRALEVEGRLIAWGGVYCGVQAEILTIGVDPAHRRRGHGSRLLRDLLEIAAARGAREVFLEVRADDPGAQALYAGHGFEPLAIRPNYYPRSGRDALVMRLGSPLLREKMTNPGR
ncbi:MAG: ribosomal protein S18-alanine N-acetyltransferase [bacterium]|nr:ribosomal protein S18-alanine N-acetyltransferase [bacterium]